MRKRIGTMLAVILSIVVNGSPVHESRQDEERAAFAGFVEATPLLWGGGEADPTQKKEGEKERVPTCFTPWLSSYMEGDTAPIRNMLACAVRRWPVPGGIDKAISVVDCESSFNPFTVLGPHRGLFQHNEKYWHERWKNWGSGLNFSVPDDPFDAWASIIVSVRIINRYGWSAWSCG